MTTRCDFCNEEDEEGAVLSSCLGCGRSYCGRHIDEDAHDCEDLYNEDDFDAVDDPEEDDIDADVVNIDAEDDE